MRVASYELVFKKINVRVASLEMLVANCLFKKIKIQAASNKLEFNKQSCTLKMQVADWKCELKNKKRVVKIKVRNENKSERR